MMDEDLSVFFDTAGFGSLAVFRLPDETTFEIEVIFDDSFINPETGLLSLETTEPKLTCPMERVEALQEVLRAANNGSDTIPGQSVPLRTLPVRLEAAPQRKFQILQVQPDGTGLATIQLAVE